MDAVKLDKIKIDDNFWQEKIDLVTDVVLPYQWSALHDEIDGADKSYVIDNFKKAAKVLQKKKQGLTVPTYPTGQWHYSENDTDKNSFHGWVFQDSDLYKWIEGASYSLINTPSMDMENKINEAIELIENAAQSDGYIDTLYTINNIDNRFESLKDFHELYCFGHLAEAAFAHYAVTKSERLLNIAKKFANMLYDTFIGENVKGCPGHPLCEMALLKLYKITNDKKHLELANYFINNRGMTPNYFDTEKGITANPLDYVYNQAHKPVRQQNEAVGHAVRAVYLYNAMAIAARIDNDKELQIACNKLFDNIVNCKMYCTGGIGSQVNGEAFGDNFELPDDTAYCETCASIGLSFFCNSMFENEQKSIYGDVFERALYNTVLGATAADGKSFFYVNAPMVLKDNNDDDKKHITKTRQKWFGCACCPPNYARFIESIVGYAFYENNNTFCVNQFIGANIESIHGKISIKSDYIENGKVSIEIKAKGSFTLLIRIPNWCDTPEISVPYKKTDDGFAEITIDSNTSIDIEFKPKILICKEDKRVLSDKDKCYIKRGVFVYCCESTDNKDLSNIKIENDMIKEYQNGQITFENNSNKITLIPFYKRLNRGKADVITHINI